MSRAPTQMVARDAAGWNAYGSQSSSRGDPAGAAEAFYQALRLAPGTTEIHSHLGMALSSTGRVDLGIDHLRAAVRLGRTSSAVGARPGQTCDAPASASAAKYICIEIRLQKRP